MAEANFIFEPEPYRLTHKLAPDIDVFRIARDVADIVLEQSIIEERTDYLAISHSDSKVPIIMQEALAHARISSVDISSHVTDGTSHTTFHLHDRDRAGRTIHLEQQTAPGDRDGAFMISDSLCNTTRDFPFVTPKIRSLLSGEIVRDWLERQLYDNDVPPPQSLPLEELRDNLGLFASRQTHIQLGQAALGASGAALYAMREQAQNTFELERRPSERTYTVWVTGRFNPAATHDAGLITLRTYTKFDGNDLFHPGNTIEYHVEADDVIDSKSMFLRGLIQASSQAAHTVERFQRAQAQLLSR